MRLIVGLGNPGRRYEATRHNVGFLVADRLSAQLRAPFVEGKGDFLVAHAEAGDAPLAIIKPTTYMNESGLAVRQATEIYDTTAGSILIVFDDFQIPLGTLRIRPRGSDGGHNGMASVIYHAGTDEIARLRCGIGRESVAESEGSSTSFVLSPFDGEEVPVVNEMVERATEAAMMCVLDGIGAAMNGFNRNPEPNE